MINKPSRNKNFEMIFYGYLLDAVDELGNAKIKVVKELISNRTKRENAYLGNIKHLAKQSKVSYPTAHEVIKVLKERNFCQIRGGVIYINPHVICDGRFKNKIMINYTKQKTELPFPDY